MNYSVNSTHGARRCSLELVNLNEPLTPTDIRAKHRGRDSCTIVKHTPLEDNIVMSKSERNSQLPAQPSHGYEFGGPYVP